MGEDDLSRAIGQLEGQMQCVLKAVDSSKKASINSHISTQKKMDKFIEATEKRFKPIESFVDRSKFFVKIVASCTILVAGSVSYFNKFWGIFK